MTPNMISRRTLLAGASGLGVAAIGLTACQPGTEDAEGPAGGAPGEQTPGLQLPTYTPFGDVEPDLPGDAELGLPAAYFHFPEIQEMAGIPLPETEPFSYLAQMPLTQTPQPGNPWYDKFVADMGNRFEMIAGGYAEYLQKFSVTMAGGELPDLVMIEPVPQLERLLDEKFHDLTPYLGGDNIQEYPGLASLPTATWRVCVQGGKLRGV
ncbi:hypothetical protein [Microlunatus sp. Y2014]|uniref:hypothetical protein n=1 Tax=Microlunatus sp. Y2014 TaxID=3418488 RepID=UPI003DA70815